MEDSQRHDVILCHSDEQGYVAILILMEDSQRPIKGKNLGKLCMKGRNPYFNGR